MWSKNSIFGLCNTTTYVYLIALRSKSCPESLDFNKKKSFLEQFACEYAKDTDNFSKHLKICSKLYEMHDRELTKKVVERFFEKWEITFRHPIFSHDVGRLFHVLQERQKLLELELDRPTFVGDSLKRFMSKMANLTECIKVSNGELKLKIFGC